MLGGGTDDRHMMILTLLKEGWPSIAFGASYCTTAICSVIFVYVEPIWGDEVLKLNYFVNVVGTLVL